jgi:hypothetical protein
VAFEVFILFVQGSADLHFVVDVLLGTVLDADVAKL